LLIGYCLLLTSLSAQELYPLADNASNVPKGVCGLRLMNNSFIENGTLRNLSVARGMIGLTSKWTATFSVSVSNHHAADLPKNLVNHTHTNTGTIYYTSTPQRGLPYPYLFNGFYVYSKYRFLTHDRQNEHFRMAAYGEWSGVSVAHDEAEPNLIHDTGGYGFGIISTYLKNKFAVSLTTGLILPKRYEGNAPDPLTAQLISTEIDYGKAFKYTLSLGYLIYPKEYNSYHQINWNLYLEFMGKNYTQAKVYQYGGTKEIPVSTPLLLQGNYVDVCPGIQAIINSNLRLDLSATFPMINRSYAHFYPMIEVGAQYYFYSNRKNHE
jgi:hypothetical protein